MIPKNDFGSLLGEVASKFNLSDLKSDTEGGAGIILYTQEGKQIESLQEIKSKQKLYVAPRDEPFKPPGSVQTNRIQSAPGGGSLAAALALLGDSDEADEDREISLEAYSTYLTPQRGPCIQISLSSENCWEQQRLETEALRAYFGPDLKGTHCPPYRSLVLTLSEQKQALYLLAL